MTDEIKRLQRSGVGRPKGVTIHGGKEDAGGRQTQILGAAPITDGPVEVLDKNSQMPQVEPEVRVHEEITVEGQTEIRSRPMKPGETQIRLRQSTVEGADAWDKAKRGED